MNYKVWVDLFGCSTDDKNLQNALANAGIEELPYLSRDHLRTEEEVSGQGMTLEFRDAILLGKKSLVEGPVYLAQVVMHLQDPEFADLYNGPLPYDLKREDSQGLVRKLLGEPAEIDGTIDVWEIDNLELEVVYTEDLGSLMHVTVAVPLVD